MDPILKKAAEFADGMLDLISWMGNRMESKKKLATPEDVIGQNAEVTIPIKKGQTGEVIVVVENTRLTYGARGTNTEHEFHKGEIVVVSRMASSLVYVEKRKESGDARKNNIDDRNSSPPEATEKRAESASNSGSTSGGKKKSKQEKTEILDDKHSEGHS